MNTKRLTRSQTDRMLGGVCGGLAQYFNIDPTLVRLVFLVLLLGVGSSFLLYIVLWIVIPREDMLYSQNNLSGDDIGRRARQMGDEMRDAVSTPNPRAIQFIGIGLVVFGLSTLIHNLNIPILRQFNDLVAWPLVLIVAGGILLYRAFRK